MKELADMSYDEIVEHDKDVVAYMRVKSYQEGYEQGRFDEKVGRVKPNYEISNGDKTKLIHAELGSLTQMSNVLWEEMRNEIKHNGYSDLTLNIEGAVRGIKEIIEMNNIVEFRKGEDDE